MRVMGRRINDHNVTERSSNTARGVIRGFDFAGEASDFCVAVGATRHRLGYDGFWAR